jgi:hypothetical protein
MNKLIDAHHVECRRSSKFSKTPAQSCRKTELYLWDKNKSNRWSDKKYSTESMNRTKKSIFKSLENEFTKCECSFNTFLEGIKSSSYLINEDNEKKIMATYIAMNICRNPNNLDAALKRNKKNFKDKMIRNQTIDSLIRALFPIFYYNMQHNHYFIKTTDELLICPDSIIYSVRDKNYVNDTYHIMPLTHNKYLLCCYDFHSMKGKQIKRNFTANEINNLSFMSNCQYLCGDDNTICLNIMNNFIVNDFVYH